MKTPEELAYDYGEKFDGVEISKNDINIAWYEGYQAAASQWISVKEKLPNLGAVVLTANTIGSVNTKYFGVNGFRDEQVTHWMSLPTRPSTQD